MIVAATDAGIPDVRAAAATVDAVKVIAATATAVRKANLAMPRVVVPRAAAPRVDGIAPIDVRATEIGTGNAT